MNSSLTDFVIGLFLIIHWKDFTSITQYHGQKARYFLGKNNKENKQ